MNGKINLLVIKIASGFIKISLQAITVKVNQQKKTNANQCNERKFEENSRFFFTKRIAGILENPLGQLLKQRKE